MGEERRPGRHLQVDPREGCAVVRSALRTASRRAPTAACPSSFATACTFAVVPIAGPAIWDGQWHAVAGSFDGSTLRAYLDGALVGSAAHPTPIAYALSLVAEPDDRLVPRFALAVSLRLHVPRPDRRGAPLRPGAHPAAGDLPAGSGRDRAAQHRQRPGRRRHAGAGREQPAHRRGDRPRQADRADHERHRRDRPPGVEPGRRPAPRGDRQARPDGPQLPAQAGQRDRRRPRRRPGRRQPLPRTDLPRPGDRRQRPVSGPAAACRPRARARLRDRQRRSADHDVRSRAAQHVRLRGEHDDPLPGHRDHRLPAPRAGADGPAGEGARHPRGDRAAPHPPEEAHGRVRDRLDARPGPRPARRLHRQRPRAGTTA